METVRSPFIDWGAAGLSLAGETRSGDAYVVKTWEKRFLAAVIDGLGHGNQAADAAAVAAGILTGPAPNPDDLVSLMSQCHESLLRTRGVVLSLALFDAANHAMTWLGVGNVEGLLFHAAPQANPARESLLRRGGVVGYQMPPLRPSTIPVSRGDLLIFSTDGIRSGFEKEVNPEIAPRQIADMILENYRKKEDDALVLVVRYTGGPP